MASFEREIVLFVLLCTNKQAAGKSALCHWTLSFKYVYHIYCYILSTYISINLEINAENTNEL